jgi:hypothetical protein
MDKKVSWGQKLWIREEGTCMELNTASRANEDYEVVPKSHRTLVPTP